ncbi:MAG: succinyl-diaminopimelate desuccinylase [Alphaproteobacteria bacterium]
MPALDDPVDLLRRLIAAPSVTPADAGALDIVEQAAGALGFETVRLPFGGPDRPTIDNLYARRGRSGPCLAFAGHTDVVPPGEAQAWRHDPFGAVVDGDHLFGRGAVDMKGAIACFLAAVARAGTGEPDLALIITGDEEGPAQDGTVRVVDWLKARGERIDHCIVGEPTNPSLLGEMIKIGRRGSLNVTLTATGRQGHIAYPHLADNPIPSLIKVLDRLIDWHLDDGTPHFQPSSLQVATVDVGNRASNVIPASAAARFNIRFNDLHTAASLTDRIEAIVNEAGKGRVTLEASSNAEAFVTAPGPFTDRIAEAVAAETGRTPDLSTTGGTSDARFLKDLCPVVEFGLVGQTMHKVDEHVSLADLEALTRIYARIISQYAAMPSPG